MQFCPDLLVEEFFETFFPPNLLEIYHSLPLGIMRADLWRYSVLFIFGGLYTDIDTVCRKPISQWLDMKNHKGLQVACEADSDLFSQWTIAAKPSHPVLLTAIRLITERIAADGGVDESRFNFVEYYTGSHLWTTAVKDYLDTNIGARQIYESREIWDSLDIEIHSDSFFDGDNAWHLNASFHWRRIPSGYLAWLDERRPRFRSPTY